MSQIECRNLNVKYENNLVLKDISFSINQGDYLCIVGENGSGKSTLVKTILGLESPKSGEILFNDNLKKCEVGYLPQQNKIQKDFPASVYEVVLSGLLNSRGLKPFYSKREKDIADDMIDALGIRDISRKSFRELSGGQQQRVLLARALCSTKKIIFLDEPITGLDPTITREMYDIIKKINKKGITVVMVSHDINFSIENASKILHLKNQIKFFGETKDYLKSQVSRKFIGEKVDA